MKRWFRRLLALLLLFVWLLAILSPAVAIFLAIEKEIDLGSAQGRQVRVFLLQEPENEGVGVEWTRPVADPIGAAARCRQTSLRYLMWVGDGENATYCRCFDESGALRDSFPGSCIPPDQ